jgi:hypothetical protein
MSSKQDYEATASILRSFITDSNASPVARSTVELVAIRLAIHYGEGNPKFDKQRFLIAAGVGTLRAEADARVAQRLAESEVAHA